MRRNVVGVLLLPLAGCSPRPVPDPPAASAPAQPAATPPAAARAGRADPYPDLMRDPGAMKFILDPADPTGGRLVGVWRVDATEEGGVRVDATEEGGVRVDGPGAELVTRVVFTTTRPADAARRCDIYTATLDPTADPPRLTGAVVGGETPGVPVRGVYRLDGDRLVLWWAYGTQRHPDGFQTAPGDGTVRLVLSRAAADPTARAEPHVAPDAGR